MPTVLPTAPATPSILPVEPRSKINPSGDTESFAKLLDQHQMPSAAKDAAIARDGTESDDPEEVAPGQAKDDKPALPDAALLPVPLEASAPPPAAVLPFFFHPFLKTEIPNSPTAQSTDTDGSSIAAAKPQTEETATLEITGRVRTRAMPDLASAATTLPTWMAQNVPKAPLAGNGVPVLTQAAPQTNAFSFKTLSGSLPAPNTSSTQPATAETPSLERGVAATSSAPNLTPIASPQVAAPASMPASFEKAPSEPGMAPIASPQTKAPGIMLEAADQHTLAEESSVEATSPKTGQPQIPTTQIAGPEIALESAGQNMPVEENSVLASTSRPSPEPARAPSIAAIAEFPEIAPFTGAAAVATPKIDMQTRALKPGGTSAAKGGDVMPNSTLQAPKTPHEVNSAGVVEVTDEPRAAAKTPNKLSTSATTSAAQVAPPPAGKAATSEKNDPDTSHQSTPDEIRREVDSAILTTAAGKHAEFDAPLPELAPSLATPKLEPSISRIEMTQIIDRTADAAIRMRTLGNERVEVAVQLESGATVNIQLRMTNGEVTPVIRTNSEALRTALEQNWSQFSERSADRNVRLTPPVFDLGQSSSNMSDLSQQRHGRDTAFTDRQAETLHFVPRLPHAPAVASTKPTQTTDGINLYA